MCHSCGKQPNDLVAFIHAELPADHLKVFRKFFAIAPRRNVKSRIVLARQKIARQKRLYHVPNTHTLLLAQGLQLHFLFSLRLMLRLL